MSLWVASGPTPNWVFGQVKQGPNRPENSKFMEVCFFYAEETWKVRCAGVEGAPFFLRTSSCIFSAVFLPVFFFALFCILHSSILLSQCASVLYSRHTENDSKMIWYLAFLTFGKNLQKPKSFWEDVYFSDVSRYKLIRKEIHLVLSLVLETPPSTTVLDL